LTLVVLYIPFVSGQHGEVMGSAWVQGFSKHFSNL